MSWDSNPYYNPEKHGLEVIDSIEWSDGGYSFDLTVLWRRLSDGALLWADDSGCSCPSPFEDYADDGSLTLITDPEPFFQHLESNRKHSGLDVTWQVLAMQTKVGELLAAAKEAA